MKHRTTMDAEKPCLACGAPWAVTWEQLGSAEEINIDWVPVCGNCSAQCFATGKATLMQFNAALAERHGRGW